MKRLHVHIYVADLDKAVGFYATLFDAEPTVLKDDYAKWALDDPRVNFAISARERTPGLSHLGIQVDNDAELAAIGARLTEAGREVFEQKNAACCYARSDKGWVTDPAGISWETFHSLGGIPVYGADDLEAADAAPETDDRSACC